MPAQVSKANAYAVLSAPSGAVSKSVAYAVLSAGISVEVSKAVVYAVLAMGASINDVTPPTGSPLGGTPVTLNGTGFTGSTGATFDGVAATDFVVVDDETITCKAPPHAAGGPVDVTVVGPNVTKEAAFTYAWTLTCTPNHGTALGGTRVTITRS